MKVVSWKEAMEVALNYKNEGKVTFISFVDNTCRTCGDLIMNLDGLENEKFQILVVEDGHSMPFPPTQYPTSYSYVPNTSNEMPLAKVGSAPKDIIINDIKAQIKTFETGGDYYEICREFENR